MQVWTKLPPNPAAFGGKPIRLDVRGAPDRATLLTVADILDDAAASLAVDAAARRLTGGDNGARHPFNVGERRGEGWGWTGWVSRGSRGGYSLSLKRCRVQHLPALEAKETA